MAGVWRRWRGAGRARAACGDATVVLLNGVWRGMARRGADAQQAAEKAGKCFLGLSIQIILSGGVGGALQPAYSPALSPDPLAQTSENSTAHSSCVSPVAA